MAVPSSSPPPKASSERHQTTTTTTLVVDKVQSISPKRAVRCRIYLTKKDRFVLRVYDDDDDGPAYCDDEEQLDDATTNSCSQNEATKRYS